MGLDVTAYEYAMLTEPHEWEEECIEVLDHRTAFIIHPSFHRSLRGLEEDRCYEVSGQTAEVGNSYGGHGIFRAALSEQILEVPPEEVWNNTDEYVDAPFFELINFADSEGTIGPEAAADLYVDFFDNREQFNAGCDEYSRLPRKYDEWTEVMRVAADTGMVVFH